MLRRRWKMKQTKCVFLLALSLLMSLTLGMVTFAAEWKTGAEPNQNRWWYDYQDGTYARDGWFWLDGNQDGIAECYYFDSEGWMLANTTTPDGYQVNEHGAWIENGVVMTQIPEPAQGNQLIVYFSRTGTTERAAQRIHQLTGAAMVKIQAAEDYPSSYDATLSRAQRELDSGARPTVTTVVDNMEQYSVIYVGYPIWFGTAPMPVFTFLENYDWSGKTIVPFCTSGSSGAAASVRDIRRSCPNSHVIEGQRVNDVSGIEGWLAGAGLIR